MAKRALLLSLGLVSTAAFALPSEPPQVVLHGTVLTESGEHPAWFTLMCTQGSGGALTLMLGVIRETAPNFPFDAYEGPGAPASFQPSAQLRIGQQTFKSVAVSGWYSGDHPDMFVFASSAPTRQRKTVTTIAAALGKSNATLTWIQNSNNVQTPPLMAQFVPDAVQRRELQHIAAPCLPRNH